MLILASASPRRAELLKQIDVAFVTAVADIDETPTANEDALSYVARMAREKALTIAAQAPERAVLGADTAIALEQQILGKPVDRAHAVEMLLALSAREHQVMTAITLCWGDAVLQAHSISQVRFTTITRAQAEAYWDTGEPADKAGSYAIQGRAAVFIEHIAGSYSGIMGLPLFETAQLLDMVGLR